MSEKTLIKNVADFLCESAKGHCNGYCENCPCVMQAECLVKKGMITTR